MMLWDSRKSRLRQTASKILNISFSAPLLFLGNSRACTGFAPAMGRQCKEFDAVRRRIAQRFKQPGRDQDRHIMRLAIEHPGHLFRRQTCRKLSEQR